ncbi:hypothetical protein TrVE_jg13786 [Triparma verrucosa]|uniref:Uncharacterized protein n=1 Tax=Triparma verrucosa TaxID=1606542 RepID=A0A9W7C5H2_9STRA|nr:hypothetical protein TrVE_jg13786 [Triparma verrucosa]
MPSHLYAVVIVLAVLAILAAPALAASAPNTVDLLFYPGAGLSSSQYSALLSRIREVSLKDYNLNVTVTTTDPLPLWSLWRLIFQPLSTILEKHSFSEFKKYSPSSTPPPPLFTCGHSLGGLTAVPASFVHATGHINLGATLNSGSHAQSPPRSAATYPKPLLQLLGSLDGYIRSSYGAAELAAADDAGHPPHRSCVAVIPVTHQQMCDGTQTKIANRTGRVDYPPSLSLEEAHAEIALTVAAFLAANVLPSSPDRERAVAKLTSLHASATSRFETLRSELTDDAHRSHARRATAALSLMPEDLIDVVLYKGDGIGDPLTDFIYSKPRIEDGRLTVSAYVEKSGGDPNSWTWGGGGASVAPAIIVKSKSAEAFGRTGGATGSEISSENIDWAEARRPEILIGDMRIRAYDEMVKGGPEFVKSVINATVCDDKFLNISSPYLTTAVDLGDNGGLLSQRFGGMHYVKSITRAQALEFDMYQRSEFR